MKLYTKTGDAGETALFGGKRVVKSDARVEAYGAVDSANSVIGWCRVSAKKELGDELDAIMSDLFDVGAELATPPEKNTSLQDRLVSAVTEQRVTRLEKAIDAAEEQLEPLVTFVLPTGCETAARFHMARTEVRRAERRVVALHESGAEVRGIVVAYLNRLSDLLFSWARLANLDAEVSDVKWLPLKDRNDK